MMPPVPDSAECDARFVPARSVKELIDQEDEEEEAREIQVVLSWLLDIFLINQTILAGPKAWTQGSR